MNPPARKYGPLTATEKAHAWRDAKSLVMGHAEDWASWLEGSGRVNVERRKALRSIMKAIRKVRRTGR